MTPPAPDEIRKTTCYMCACRCGIDVHVRGNSVRHIEGNRDHPVNKGVLCAKGAAGVMQHLSPARLRAPLRRTGPRGSGEFREISWNEALGIATTWLEPIRDRHPEKLAFFTGRDQSQALTGWWAQQFGTPNYAAHGGFCSVNMAAAGIYTLGGAFWEFGSPDWEHTRLLLLFGVAEDHDSNPMKIGLGKLKARGTRVISINPVRTGYSRHRRPVARHHPRHRRPAGAQPDPPADDRGQGRPRLPLRYTNAAHLVDQGARSPGFGSFLRDRDGRELIWDRDRHKAVAARHPRCEAGALRQLQQRPDPRQAGVPADGRGLPRPRPRPRGGRPRLRPRPRRRSAASPPSSPTSPSTRRSPCPAPGPTSAASATRR